MKFGHVPVREGVYYGIRYYSVVRLRGKMMKKKKKEIIIKIIPTPGSFYRGIFLLHVYTRRETGPLLHHKTHTRVFGGLMIRFYASAILGAAVARACAAVLGVRSSSTRRPIDPVRVVRSESVIKKKPAPRPLYIETERIACDRVETLYNGIA